MKDLTRVQQQRPESPTVTLTWRVCKYKVHKLHQKYILMVYFWWSLCTLYLHACKKDVPLVEFMYLVFTRMPGESYRRQLRSLLLYLCYIFRALINSLVGCYYTKPSRYSLLQMCVLFLCYYTKPSHDSLLQVCVVCVLFSCYYTKPSHDSLLQVCVVCVLFSCYYTKPSHDSLLEVCVVCCFVFVLLH